MDERNIREGLTEDELELFNLLKKDKMTQEETQKVRLAAKSLLHRLLQEHPRVLVQDWYKDTQTKKIVRSAVEQVLHSSKCCIVICRKVMIACYFARNATMCFI